MKQKFLVTLEVEVDADAFSNGSKNGAPNRWNWQRLMRDLNIDDLRVSVEDCYVACCEAKKDWYASEENSYGKTFDAYFHDENCVNFEPLDIDDEEPADYDYAFTNLFGDVNEVMGNLTIRSTGL